MPDRRCFAFFHPQLPDEPLIFVEVALVPGMAGAIAPLIDERSAPLPPEAFRAAVFYSVRAGGACARAAAGGRRA